MGTIKYIVTGRHTPFFTILINNTTGVELKSDIIHIPNYNSQFDNIPNGDYIIEVYDTAGGFSESSLISVMN